MGYRGDKLKEDLEKTRKELNSEEEEIDAEEEADEEEEETEEEEDEEEDTAEKENHRERVIVKGYMRPDGTSYYVVIPKEIRELFGLKGGEYFLIKPKVKKGKIELKLAKFVEE
jgi:AbrB family looped-hinge helix DNA binding protein